MPAIQDSLASLNQGHTAKSGYGIMLHGTGAPTTFTTGLGPIATLY